MTISDFIEYLQNLKDKHGDIPVYRSSLSKHNKETIEESVYVQTTTWKRDPNTRFTIKEPVELTPARLIIYDAD